MTDKKKIVMSVPKTEYLIVTGASIYMLEDSVNDYLRKGYELFGTLVVSVPTITQSNPSGRPIFYQPMIRTYWEER
jgi:hypothetical protein